MKGLNVKVVLTLILFVFTFSGCDKDVIQPDAEYSSQKLASCSESKSWDYSTTKSNLLGLWEWQYDICCGENSKPSKNDTQSKGLKIEFKDDGTGVMVDFDAIGDFKWDIQLVNDVYEFSLEPQIPQLDGQIVICDGFLITDASYKDGAANFFKKTN